MGFYLSLAGRPVKQGRPLLKSLPAIDLDKRALGKANPYWRKWIAHPVNDAEGKIRARFRNSTKKPEPLEPGKIYEYTLDLWHTGITIPAGDRLRVEVASASFPLFSRHLNMGGHNETGTAFRQSEPESLSRPEIPFASSPAGHSRRPAEVAGASAGRATGPRGAS